jgi:hypothetical protein
MTERRHAEPKGKGPARPDEVPVAAKLHLGENDVEALIQSLEALGAATRAAETADVPPLPAGTVALSNDIAAHGADERMSDEDLEDLALVLKMTRSAMNARQCGLRLLEETRRAREAEAQLLREVPAAGKVRRFPAA